MIGGKLPVRPAGCYRWVQLSWFNWVALREYLENIEREGQCVLSHPVALKTSLRLDHLPTRSLLRVFLKLALLGPHPGRHSAASKKPALWLPAVDALVGKLKSIKQNVKSEENYIFYSLAILR